MGVGEGEMVITNNFDIVGFQGRDLLQFSFHLKFPQEEEDLLWMLEHAGLCSRGLLCYEIIPVGLLSSYQSCNLHE